MAVRFDVITLFPELFAPFQTVGVTRRAFETKAVDVRLWQLRDFAEGVYRRVDDRPFGGGPGMVMLVEPLVRCLSAIRADQQAGCRAPFARGAVQPGGQALDAAACAATGRRAGRRAGVRPLRGN
jgi:tRNA (guanine37-N1)-methyltransferase